MVQLIINLSKETNTFLVNYASKDLKCSKHDAIVTILDNFALPEDRGNKIPENKSDKQYDEQSEEQYYKQDKDNKKEE